MTQFDSSSTAPTSGDFSMPAEPPSWPKVVGIISIVWGSLGVLCNICGVIGQASGNFLMTMVPPEQQEAMKAQMAAGGIAQIALYVVSALVSILLIVAGVTTLKRQATGRMLHLAYGAIGIVLTIAGTFIALKGIDAQIAAMSNNPNTPPQALAGAKMGSYFGMAFGVCIGLAYPLFCLIWFGAIKRTHKDMTGGFEQEPIV